MERKSFATSKFFLSSVSVKALNYSSRLTLANSLKCKQPFQSEKGFARDYRGLAEQIGFKYHIIKMFEEFEDCTMKILEAWEFRPDATLDKLISYLEEMDRHDIIEALIPSLQKNVETYLEYHNSSKCVFQDPEGYITYDAYLACAEEDYAIAAEIIKKLESPNVQLKLFIHGRDIFDECSVLDTPKEFQFIKDRCRHVVILITRNFLKSPALEFVISFTESLTIEQKQRAILSVIWEHCEIPPMLNSVPQINFCKDSQVWKDLMFESLITSLLPKSDIVMFLPS